MKAEAVILYFSAVLIAGLAGCAHTGGVAGAEKVEANYPDVWERVLPEEMRTNIANYDAGDLYPVEEKYTNLLDYAVSVAWRIDEVYHIDGKNYDDVIFRFVDWKKGLFLNFDATFAIYYSFFEGRLLSKDGKYEFPLNSTVYDLISSDNAVHRLSLPSTITLSNGVVYDENIMNYKSRNDGSRYEGFRPSCFERPDWGGGVEPPPLRYYWTSHEAGVQFLPVGYAEEDVFSEDSWLLLQGLDEPRFVSKRCTLGAVLVPTRVYGYYEYSFLRVSDDVVPLPDGTFLFAGTRDSFPTFHIIRMRPDMSIPAMLSNRYRWVRYKDYVGILDLYERRELFSEPNMTCPLLDDASHPHCVKVGKDGGCSIIKGWYLEYDIKGYWNSFVSSTDGLSGFEIYNTHPCLDLALRDYVRGKFEIYHCGDGEEAVASIMPCDKKDNNSERL